MTKGILFYHLYLSDSTTAWVDIFIQQMDSIVKKDLIAYLEEVKVTAITQNDERVDVLKNLCRHYNIKFDLEFVQNPYKNDQEMVHNLNGPKTVSEEYTLSKIHQYCLTEDANVCYIHNKGMTSHIRHLMNSNLTEVYLRNYYWRKYLDWGVLGQWYKYHDRLSYYDVMGINYREHPSKHFSGNYWWSKSSYIKTLPKPSDLNWWNKLKEKSNDSWLKSAPNRFKDEHWICCGKDVKVFAYHNTNKINPAEQIYHPQNYNFI